MICYKGITWCSGGSPRCAYFSECPKALTEDVQARAKAVGLYVSAYVAPEAMPCYSRTAEVRGETKTGRRITFRSVGMGESEWRAHFEKSPRRSDLELAEVIGCSDTTIRNNRVRLGYPPAKPSGVTRWTLFDEADALRLVEAYKKTGGKLAEAARSIGMRKNSAKHIRRRFRDLFEAHGF